MGRANFQTRGDPEKTYCDLSGPKLIFTSVLVSGASFPNINPSDFEALGIYKRFYGAQSATPVVTSNGMMLIRLYETHVELTGNEGTLIIDPSNPLHPDLPLYIGGLCPVFLYEYPGVVILYDQDGEAFYRVSGRVLFVASYLTVTPRQNTISMGENRNGKLSIRCRNSLLEKRRLTRVADVLGAHEILLACRGEPGLNLEPARRKYWAR